MSPIAPSPSLSPPIAIVVVVAIIVNFVARRAVAIVVVTHRAVTIIIADFVACRANAIVVLSRRAVAIVVVVAARRSSCRRQYVIQWNVEEAT